MFPVTAVLLGGNPLNAIFVIWWAVGGYGIYAGIRATIALGKVPFSLDRKYQIGILMGIISFLPLIVLLSIDRGFGTSKFIVLAAVGLIPACYLFIYSIMVQKYNEPNNAAQKDRQGRLC